MTAEEASHLEIDLGKHGKQSFEDLGTYDEWYTEQRQAWRWVEALSSKTAREVQQRALPHWNALDMFLQRAKDSGGNNLQQQGSSIRTDAKRLFCDEGWPPRDSEEAQFVLGLRSREGDGPAVAALAELLPHTNPYPPEPDALRGVVEVALFKRGLSDESILARKEALEKLMADARTQFGSQRGLQTRLQNDTRESLRESREETARIRDAHAEDREGFQRTFDQVLEEKSGELQALVDAYEAKVATKAAATYWSRKQKGHEERSRFWAWVFASSLLLASAAFFGLIVWLDRLFDDEVGLEATVFLVLLATPVLWGLRLIAKNLQRHLHLAADAVERRVIIDTYVALSKEQAIKEADRAPFFQAIFRSAATGMVKDDSSPPGLVDTIQRKVGGA